MQRDTPCPECPWNVKAEKGKFTVERYRSLAGSSKQELCCIFACHMSHEDHPIACAGYLAVCGGTSINVRLMQAYGHIDLERVKIPEDHVLYGSYGELAVANGVDPDDPVLDDPDIWRSW